MKARKKTIIQYCIGYKFEDGDENCIWVTRNKDGIAELIEEVEKEYHEKPIVWTKKVKVYE